MRQILEALRSSWGALLLREEAYDEVRDAANPVIRGLTIIVVIVILVSLVAIAGQALAWATTPSLADMHDVLLRNIQRMPWYQDLARDEQAADLFRRWFSLGWDVFGPLAGLPNVASAAIGVITRPAGFIILWLILGIFAHITARILGGTASLSQTLGTTSLMVAPQLLRLVQVLPYVEIGSVLGAWALACGYLAIKRAHRLSWARTFWAILLALVLVAIVVATLVALLVLLGVALASRGG
mgnify:CR=1 FL=1